MTNARHCVPAALQVDRSARWGDLEEEVEESSEEEESEEVRRLPDFQGPAGYLTFMAPPGSVLAPLSRFAVCACSCFLGWAG
jgi:hypothetical protein